MLDFHFVVVLFSRAMASTDTKHLTNTSWHAVVQGLAEMRNSDLSAYGADIILCSGSIKVLIHEILARRFTTIFDVFLTDSINDLKDENGVVVLILPYVSGQSLRAMSELLYSGQTRIISEKTMSDLDSLLTKELSCSVVIDTSEQKQVDDETLAVKNAKMMSPFEQTFEVKEPKTLTPYEQVTIKVDYDAHDEDMEDSYVSDDDFKDPDFKVPFANELPLPLPMPSAKREMAAKIEPTNGEFKFDEAALKALGREPTRKEKDSYVAKIGKKSDTNGLPFMCLLCGKRAKRPHDLIISHILMHTGERPWRCDKCPKAYISKNALKQHKLNHEAGGKPPSEKKYQCEMCPKSFVHKRSLEEHIRTHTGERPYQCELCPRSFSYDYLYRKHVEKIHKKDPSEASAVAAQLNEESGHIIIKDSTNDGTPADPPDIQLDEKLVESVGRPLTQVEQNQLFVKIGSIYHSWKPNDDFVGKWGSYSEESKGKYLCLVCGQFRDAGSSIKSHTKLVHKGIRPKKFKCPHCDHHSATSTQVQRHIRTNHTKEKPFQCEYCSSAFSTKTQLNHHVFTHTGEQKFQCKLCPKKFAINERLVVHMRTHTGEKPYQCHLCSAMFAAKSNLNAHVRGVHKESLYKCKFCSSTFEKRGKLEEHVKFYHSEGESKVLP